MFGIKDIKTRSIYCQTLKVIFLFWLLNGLLLCILDNLIRQRKFFITCVSKYKLACVKEAKTVYQRVGKVDVFTIFTCTNLFSSAGTSLQIFVCVWTRYNILDLLCLPSWPSSPKLFQPTATILLKNSCPSCFRSSSLSGKGGQRFNNIHNLLFPVSRGLFRREKYFVCVNETIDLPSRDIFTSESIVKIFKNQNFVLCACRAFNLHP